MRKKLPTDKSMTAGKQQNKPNPPQPMSEERRHALYVRLAKRGLKRQGEGE